MSQGCCGDWGPNLRTVSYVNTVWHFNTCCDLHGGEFLLYGYNTYHMYILIELDPYLLSSVGSKVVKKKKKEGLAQHS
jgi:hypothetical protein